MLGEHTNMILREAGLSASEVQALLESKGASSTVSLLRRMPGKSQATVKVFEEIERLQDGPAIWGAAGTTKGFTTSASSSSSSLAGASTPPSSLAGSPAVAEATDARGAVIGTGAGPLAGLRILDASGMVAGPFAAMMLADQGAEVLKLERPSAAGLDRALQFGPGPVNGQQDMGALFFALNRNKRSLLLDTTTIEGQALLERILKTVDVVIADEGGTEGGENTGGGAGVLLPYELTQRANPRAVHLAIDRSVSELEAQAISAAACLQKEDEMPVGVGEAPAFLANMHAEKACGLYAAQSVCAALWAQGGGGPVGGAGQKLRIGLLPATLHFSFVDIFRGWGWERPTAVSQITVMSEGYKLLAMKDGRYTFAGVVSQREYEEAREAFLQVPEEKEKLWSTQPGRTADRNDFAKNFRANVGRFTLSEFKEMSEKPGVDLVWEYPRSREEVLQDPQVAANQTIESFDHPRLGKCRLARPAVRFLKTPQTIRSLAPFPGEHTEEVLREFGISEAEIGEMGKKGLVVQHGGGV